jgi:hypothetical protein
MYGDLQGNRPPESGGIEDLNAISLAPPPVENQSNGPEA